MKSSNLLTPFFICLICVIVTVQGELRDRNVIKLREGLEEEPKKNKRCVDCHGIRSLLGKLRRRRSTGPEQDNEDTDSFTAEIKFLQRWNPSMSDRQSSAYRLFKGNVLDAITEQLNGDGRFLSLQVQELKKSPKGTLATVKFHFKKRERNPVSHLKFIVSRGHLSSFKVEKNYFKILESKGVPEMQDMPPRSQGQSQSLVPNQDQTKWPSPTALPQLDQTQSPTPSPATQDQTQSPSPTPESQFDQTQSPSSTPPTQDQTQSPSTTPASQFDQTQSPTPSSATQDQTQSPSTTPASQFDQTQAPSSTPPIQDQTESPGSAQDQTQSPNYPPSTQPTLNEANDQGSFQDTQPQTTTESPGQVQALTPKQSQAPTMNEILSGTDPQALSQDQAGSSKNAKDHQGGENVMQTTASDQAVYESQNNQPQTTPSNQTQTQAPSQYKPETQIENQTPSVKVESRKNVQSSSGKKSNIKKTSHKHSSVTSHVKSEKSTKVLLKMNQQWYPFLGNHEGGPYKLLTGNIEKGLRSSLAGKDNIGDLVVKNLREAEAGLTEVELSIKFHGNKKDGIKKIKKIVKSGDIAGIPINSDFIEIDER